VPTDFFKQDFINAQSYIYSQAIALQVQQKQERRALETAELARARAFLDLLASRDVHLKDRDRRVIASWQAEDIPRPSRIELSASNQPPVSAFDAPRQQQRDESTALVRSRHRAAQLRVRKSIGRRRSDCDRRPAAVDDGRLLGRRGELFIWVVSPDGTVQVRRVSVPPARLVELIRETSPFAEKTAGAAAQSIVTRGESTVPIRTGKPVAWRALYDLLIQPIRGALPKTPGALLTIVPQGPLLNLSFAALQNAQGRYLLEDYALHYAPAGAVLQYTAPKKRADARTGPMLVVSDPALPKLTNLDRPLPRLPGARSEAAQIARLVPGEPFDRAAGLVTRPNPARAISCRTKRSCISPPTRSSATTTRLRRSLHSAHRPVAARPMGCSPRKRCTVWISTPISSC
jgi:CHAT domain-containing protein